MRRFTALYIILLICIASLSAVAARFEGEVVQVLPGDRELVLAIEGSKEMKFKLAAGARLYYNNAPATLNMYTPVTPEDFVSGYLETDESGLIKQAYFYYILREGTVEMLKDGQVTVKELENGICDTYTLKSSAKIYLNNYPAKAAEIQPGMRVLLILDYHFQVKKLAVFHYDYTGLIERVDLDRWVVVVNIGTRLKPTLREFTIGGIVRGACEDWTSLAALLKIQPLVQAKILLDSKENTICFMETRSL